MTDELRQLMNASIGTEPPLGSPHAAVRRRAGRLRRRRQATGAAFAAATVGAAAVGIPAVRGLGTRDDTGTASSPTAIRSSAAPTEIPESEFTVNSFLARDLATTSCGYTIVPASGTGPGPGALQVDGDGPGLDARAAGEPYYSVTHASRLEIGASFAPDATVVAIDRIVIALDKGPRSRVYCELRDFPMAKLGPGQAVRVFLAIESGPAEAGVYKGVAASAYRTADGVRHPADAELGFYNFT